MRKFTDKIVDYIVQENLDLKHLSIVLPSERAIKYVSASLYRHYQKPVLAPEMVTIDKWVNSLSSRTILDRTRLLVKLFSIQLEDPIDPKDSSFDEFISWGNTLLSDFDEIDRYLLDPKKVFRNLAEIKEIENWSFDSKEITPAKQRFLEFWDKLPGFYYRLNEVLDQEQKCYAGSAYRELSQEIDRCFRSDSNKVFLFAGFNALSGAELSIIRQLHAMGRAHVLIDSDTYYLNDPVHEAGSFLRKLKEELKVKQLNFDEEELLTAEKEIRVIECVQTTGQVKAAADILNSMASSDLKDTVVLLADESLIGPLLKNIPSKVGKANITLGLPLKNTSIRTWVELLFQLQENKTRFNTEAIYFQDLIKIWNHPLVLAITSPDEQRKITSLEMDSIKYNKIFRNASSISVSEKLDGLFAHILTPWNKDWETAVNSIRRSIQYIIEHLSEKDEFNKALCYGFDNSMIEFENLVAEGLPEMTLRSFRHLMQAHWSNVSIAYHGNPIEGLQIMGLLETRLLDFKNMIVLGMNEGKMPPTNPIQTLIPMDLRRYLGLPTPREKQGLFAHHFYRLLHCSEKVFITYSSAKENIGSNEESRYILQLKLELSRANPNIRIHNEIYSVSESEVISMEGQTVEKSQEVLERMQAMISSSISASAINKFLTCPLDYYFRYILEFGEEEEIEEDLESRTLGSFIHEVLETLYKPFCRHDKDGNLVSPSPPALAETDVQKMLKDFPSLLHEQFLKRFNNDKNAFSSGKNLLSYKMAHELTERFLKQEIRYLKELSEPLFIEYLEITLKSELEVDVHGQKMKVGMKGVVDRIDSIGDKYRIIDYKTGKVSEADAEINLKKSEEGFLGFDKAKHLVQLGMYSYMFFRNFGHYPAEVGLISLVNVGKGLIPLQDKNGDSLEMITDTFPGFMEALMNEMFDPTIPFTHTQRQFSYCKYCE